MYKMEEKEKKPGFFKRLVSGLTKTRDNIVSGIDSLFSGFSHIDDDFYEELEEILIMGDLGVRATESIIEDLQRKVKEQHIKEPAECKELLIESIKEQMKVEETAYRFENEKSVVLVIGVNGVGKTTILNRSVGYLEQTTGEVKSDEKNGVHVFFDNPEATFIPYDVIRSYDRPLIMGDFTARMADPNVKSELDWQLYLLQRLYLDYQVNIGNKMIELLSGDEQQRSLAPALSVPKRKFQDMIDELFSYTRKKIDRRRNDIAFYQDGELLFPYKLSSGEKQMLVILLTVLVQDNSHCVLFMDEPEASLHIEWQQKLIGMIRSLNPNVQLILTTHSPAVIMEGWLDAVTEVSEISSLIPNP